MIVTSIAVVAVIGRTNRQRTLETKAQQSFRWNVHISSTSRDLRSGSGAGSRQRADRRALAAAGDGANDGAQDRAAANIPSGAAVFTHAFFARTTLGTYFVRFG